ncbi:RICIN domain-containing protein [Salipaludibacillus agaradhaerens]|uniref:cellulase n=1 Tax=Salipaludibacillus agaradhaerens TaxID=76935 RepID=A0A9Q4G082_SALAG|nr:RICIN domain-containing protein [Salipaludibacillus agaradhaerens]MCR6097608.1 RICIN domain-containing protein [Salipaludibacillus agaradhaerens]MCR6105548.1 RICIN domain-containing protein [Salipaludibacillus agaradhaerens]MCR6112908.1 RICIN domain-containing protein [Salipaludibacillus agaradhaerens]MCR6117585.1 RICIN domain-containing protein [Salipaludibacillus agaradhaerens]
MRKVGLAVKILLVMMLVFPALLSSNQAYAWTDMPMGKLHVDGNQLVNSDGQPVVLSGWHQPSGSYWTYQSSNYYLDRNGGNRHAANLEYLKDISDTFTDTSPKYGNDHGWYMNQVRLFIDREDMGDVAAGTYNFEGLQKVTENVIIPYVEYAKTKGLYVTLGLDFTILDDKATTQSNLDKFNEIWEYLASHPSLKSADHVMFEIVNEPVLSYANGKWGGHPSDPDFEAHWDALVDFQNSIISTIRNQGADNVIWAAGLGWDQYYQLCASNPLTDPLNNTGYAVHWYPGYGANDDYSTLQQQWDTNIKPCADHYPINITETTWYKWLPGDPEYWRLFDGTNEGFGKNTKAIFTDAGNVSIAVHMNGFILEPGPRSSFADPTAGLKYDGDAERDGMARFLFDWYYERAQLYPWNGVWNGVHSGSTYKLQNRASGKMIDVPGGENTSHLQLQQWADNGATAQQWVLDDMGEYTNYYRLQSVSSSDNKVMDVRNGTSNNGEAIQLMTDFQNSAQQFRLIKLSNGYWSILNVNSNKAVEVANSSSADGALIQQNMYRGDLHQQWDLIRVD